MCNVHELSASQAFVLGPSCPICPTAHRNSAHPQTHPHLPHAIVVRSLGFGLQLQRKQHMPIMAVALGPLDNLITVLGPVCVCVWAWPES